MTRTIDMGSQTLTAMECLELELLILEFFRGLEEGFPDGYGMLLHSEITIRTGWSPGVHGRANAVRAFRRLYNPIHGSPILVSRMVVAGNAVLSEHETALPAVGGESRPVTVLSCYRIDDFMIRSWHQLTTPREGSTPA